MALLDGNPVKLASIKKLVRGKTWDPVVVVKDSNGVAINLSSFIGASKGVRCHLRQAAADASPTLTPVCTILDSGTTGRVQLLVTADDAAAVPDGITKLFGDPEFFDDTGADEIVRSPFWFEVTVDVEYTK